MTISLKKNKRYLDLHLINQKKKIMFGDHRISLQLQLIGLKDSLQIQRGKMMQVVLREKLVKNQHLHLTKNHNLLTIKMLSRINLNRPQNRKISQLRRRMILMQEAGLLQEQGEDENKIFWSFC